MSSVNQTPASEVSNSATISQDEYSQIIWKLSSIENTLNILHRRLLSLQEVDYFVLMTNAESSGFSNILSESFEGLYSITERIEEADNCMLQKIGKDFKKCSDHSGFVLNLFIPDVQKDGRSIPGIDHRELYNRDLASVLLLFNEILCNGLPACIALLEEIFAGEIPGNSPIACHASDYDSIMAARIKAIQPEFSALCERYYAGDNNELLNNPEKLGQETKKLRDEIWQLQNQIPSQSEVGMNCRLGVEQLDFLVRLINSNFDFKCHDVVTVSIIVDQALDVFTQSLDGLTPGDGGDLVDTVH